MYSLLEVILIIIVVTVGSYAVLYDICYSTWYVLTKGVSWLWGLLRRDKNKEKQTIEIPWSESRKMDLENLNNEFENLKMVDKAL